MRRVMVLAILMIVVIPAAAFARCEDRCWMSIALFGGPAVPTDEELKNEFNVAAQFGLEVKQYLWKPFSIAGAFGILYGEGRPKRSQINGEWTEFDSTGVSFWRAYSFDALLRVEIGRYWLFNPYVGGGVGGVYNTAWRRGAYKYIKYSDSYGEWLLDYMGVVGFDHMIVNEFISWMLEGRWTFMPSNDSFVDQRDFGFWSALLGIRIYL